MSGNRKIFSAVGVMSGTSLDGVDIAYCRFEKTGTKWKYRIIKSATVPYRNTWKKRLLLAGNLKGFALQILHNHYGSYIGMVVKKFLLKHRLKVDFIASHGHTVFHCPEKKLTFQIGNGTFIAAASGYPVVCDFRSGDVALGGQGAPLVPTGDELLFPEYDFCLNLGGIANISYRHNYKRIAYDICPVNIVLNYMSGKKGYEYDKNGEFARSGKINEKILSRLNALPYYKKNPPKSLGREWAEEYFFPQLEKNKISPEDKLRTCVEHIVFQIQRAIRLFPLFTTKQKKPAMLVTGGGAHNIFLIERLKALCNAEIIIPGRTIVDFKEALVFAFLGVLRWRREINCLKSVTGAKRDSCCGTIFVTTLKSKKNQHAFF